MTRLERQRKYRLRAKIARYGIEGAQVDHRGYHDAHPTGSHHPRWAGHKRLTDQGYVAVRVPVDHHLGWGPKALRRFKYAYEHDLVAEAMLGRRLTADEVVHHDNRKRDDNRPENLKVETRSSHAKEHASAPGVRDRLGRFAAGRPR